MNLLPLPPQSVYSLTDKASPSIASIHKASVMPASTSDQTLHSVLSFAVPLQLLFIRLASLLKTQTDGLLLVGMSAGSGGPGLGASLYLFLKPVLVPRPYPQTLA